ncbi:hypothetical protein AK812_SmicGene33425 [Symbiodinium microadriaticum]|uniref:Uncharacterized protein n=1 Tax=Symbiodinium microadriaticum TaxID=2951 RepID=A0A1Q9CRM8_SYMMI|nr:hypothetical protein AK812_SmicGene33425 [Symbiodinium microadriaticum]CAE7946520.1 unnamed protein product [Symbiodinium sp. KB8]
MGRGGRATKHGQDSAAAWHLWRGAYSPSQRQWKQERNAEQSWDNWAPSFPSYQSLEVEVPSDPTRGNGGAGQNQPSGPVQGLQHLLNQARKAEQRVAKLHYQKDKASLQWKAYDDKMKQEFLREKKKFGQHMERLDREISEALVLQEQARLRVFGPPGAAQTEETVPMMEENSSWELARAAWERESDQDLDGVMARALAQARAAGLTPFTPVRDRQMQPMTPNPWTVDASRMGAPAQGLDPYMATIQEAAHAPGSTPPATGPACAGKPPGLEAVLPRQAPKHPGQRDSSTPRQPTSTVPPRDNIKEATKLPPQHIASGLSLGEKLDLKRAAGPQGNVMLPFGGPQLIPAPPAHSAATPRPSLLDDDNDNDSPGEEQHVEAGTFLQTIAARACARSLVSRRATVSSSWGGGPRLWRLWWHLLGFFTPHNVPSLCQSVIPGACWVILPVPVHAMARAEGPEDILPTRSAPPPPTPVLEPSIVVSDVVIPWSDPDRSTSRRANVVCRDLPWPAAEADAADGRWLGCYVYTPHYRAVTAAVQMPPSADLQHAIDGLIECAPGTPDGLFLGMVPIRPQRFPGYLQVIRFPTFLRQVHDGYAAVMCDLTHVGGPYFPTVLPRGLSHADLTAYLLPLTSHSDETLRFYIGCRSKVWPLEAQVLLRDGDVITGTFDPSPRPLVCRVEDLERRDSWGTLRHFFAPEAHQSTCVMYQDKRYCVGERHYRAHGLYDYIVSFLGVDVNRISACTFPVQDLDVQGDYCQNIVAIADVAPPTGGHREHERRDLFVLCDLRPLGLKPKHVYTHVSRLHLPSLAADLGVALPAGFSQGVLGARLSGDTVRIVGSCTLLFYAKEETTDACLPLVLPLLSLSLITRLLRMIPTQCILSLTTLMSTLPYPKAIAGMLEPQDAADTGSTAAVGMEVEPLAPVSFDPAMDPAESSSQPGLDNNTAPLGDGEPLSMVAVVYTPDVSPEMVNISLHLPCGVAQAVARVASARLSGASCGFTRLTPVTPQPCLEFMLLVASPAWLTDRPAVLFDCLRTTRAIFAKVLFPSATRETLLIAAGLRHDSAEEIFVHGLIQPLQYGQRISLITGMVISLAPPSHGAPATSDLATRLQSREGWDEDAFLPGPEYAPGMHYWILTEGSPTLFTVGAWRRQHAREDLAWQLSAREPMLYIQPSKPVIRDAFFNGFLTSGVWVATEQLSRVPFPPARRQEQRIILIMDCRPILQGFRWLLLDGPIAKVSEITGPFQQLCPEEHVVSVEGAEAIPWGDEHVFELCCGQVLTVSFEEDISEDDSCNEDAPPPDSGHPAPPDDPTNEGEGHDRGRRDRRNRDAAVRLRSRSPRNGGTSSVPEAGAPAAGAVDPVDSSVNIYSPRAEPEVTWDAANAEDVIADDAQPSTSDPAPRRVVVCMDLLQCDGRIFAAASAPLADSYTLLNLAGFSSASQVAVFVPGTPGPIPPGEEVLLSTGDCITFVPPGADIRDRCTLNEVLSSPDGTMYETPPLPRPIEDRFCLVADGFYFDFLLTPERSFLFRQDIGLRLNLAANQVLLSPSQPRIENAQIYGRHCRSVVAVGDRTDSSLSPHCHVGFLDCRPILEGWRRVQAPGGWLNIGVIRDGFMQGAPPGYRVHVGGCLAHWEWLWVEQGQVFRVLFQTDSEDGHLPTHQPSGHSGLEVTLFEDPPGQERRSHEDPSQAAYTSAHNGPGASSHSGRAFASGAFSHICDMWDPDLVHAACLPGALGLTPVYWMFKTSLCLVPRAAVCVTQCTCRRLLIVFAWSMLLDCIEALGVVSATSLYVLPLRIQRLLISAIVVPFWTMNGFAHMILSWSKRYGVRPDKPAMSIALRTRYASATSAFYVFRQAAGASLIGLPRPDRFAQWLEQGAVGRSPAPGEIVVFTADGSFDPHSGKAGWGVVISLVDGGDLRLPGQFVGCAAASTADLQNVLRTAFPDNNAYLAEVSGLFWAALLALRLPGTGPWVFRADNISALQGVAGIVGMQEHLLCRAAGALHTAFRLIRGTPSYQHVLGHAADQANELADALANHAMRFGKSFALPGLMLEDWFRNAGNAFDWPSLFRCPLLQLWQVSTVVASFNTLSLLEHAPNSHAAGLHGETGRDDNACFGVELWVATDGPFDSGSVATQHWDQHVLPLQIGGRKGCPASFGHFCSRAFLAMARTRGQSAAILFVDIAAAYYGVIREAILGAQASGRPLDDLVAKLGMSVDDMQLLQHYITSEPVLQQQGAHELFAEVAGELHRNTWFILSGDRQIVETHRGTRPGGSLADVVFSILFSKVLQRRTRTTLQPHVPRVPWTGERSPWGCAPASSASCAVEASDVVYADDLASFLICEQPSCLPKAIAGIAADTIDTLHPHGLNANVGPTKTAALAVPAGRGSRSVRRQLFSAGAGRLVVLPESRGGLRLDLVTVYKHLGSMVMHDGSLLPEIRHRLAASRSAMKEGKQRLFACRAIPLARRVAIFRSHVLAALVPGLGTLPLFNGREWQTFSGGVMSLYRQLLCLRHEGGFRCTEAQMLSKVGLPSPESLLQSERLRFLSQLVRHGPDAAWALLGQYSGFQDALRSAARWLQGAIGTTCTLGDIESDWESWAHCMRETPGRWKAFLKRAEAWYDLKATQLAALDSFSREALSATGPLAVDTSTAHALAPAIPGIGKAALGAAEPEILQPLLDMLTAFSPPPTDVDEALYELVQQHIAPLPVLRRTVAFWRDSLPPGCLSQACDDVLMVLHPEHVCDRVSGATPGVDCLGGSFTPCVVPPKWASFCSVLPFFIVGGPPPPDLVAFIGGTARLREADLESLARWAPSQLAGACVLFPAPPSEALPAFAPSPCSLRSLRSLREWTSTLLFGLSVLFSLARAGRYARAHPGRSRRAPAACIMDF